MVEKLEKLNELKIKGILTQTEFEQEKKRIMDAELSPSSHSTAQAKEQAKGVFKPQSAEGIAGFVFAVVSNGFYLLPVTLVIYALVGLVFSILGIAKLHKGYHTGLSTAGLILSILTLLGGLYMIYGLNANHGYHY